MAETKTAKAAPTTEAEAAKTTETLQAGETTTADKRTDKVVDTTPQEVRDGSAVLISAADPDALDGLYDAADTDEMLVLKQDVLEEFVYPGTRRPSYRIAYHKGQVVARSTLLARAAELRLATADRSDLRNYIDPTTFASGTGFAAQEQAPTGTTEAK